MVAIAAMMFVALFGWGQDYFHWSDPTGKVQLALQGRTVELLAPGPCTKSIDLVVSGVIETDHEASNQLGRDRSRVGDVS